MIAPNATVTDVMTNTITVEWTPLVATYDRVIVNCVGEAGANSDIDNVTMGVNTGICEGLTPGSVYTITVTTVKDDKTTPDVSDTLTPTTVTGQYKPVMQYSLTIYTTRNIQLNCNTVKPVFKGHCNEGTPCDQETLSQNGALSSPC